MLQLVQSQVDYLQRWVLVSVVQKFVLLMVIFTRNFHYLLLQISLVPALAFLTEALEQYKDVVLRSQYF